jgi:TolB-like protein/Tfp pilus assembly protein PilF
MGGESPNPGRAGAVFLSYASQDAQAAQRICAALRAAGIEVWFDQSELRGGDAWDQKIRHEIHDCVLFIPIVSQHTQERLEGYFRHEWKLAIERTHHMAEQKAFLVPVVVDGTGDQEAFVPDAFREVQWTRLPAGETPPEFVVRIKRLLSPEAPTTARLPAGAASGSSPIPPTTPLASPWKRALPVAGAVFVVAALSYWLISKPWISKPAAPPAASNATSPPAPPAAFAPPPHSIAVLPFVNMSGDKEQEFFSDGLTEELLNSLARINELQVAARTSAFSFKGKDNDIGTIARKLNVGAVLEGSVRRSAHTVRVTAQLDNAVTGFHLWSQTYDRDLGDVLKLQAEIANAVASALKVTLLSDVSAKIELGGTRSPAAFDAYLSGSKAYRTQHNARDLDSAVAAYSEAIGLDPNYALAFAGRSMTLDEQANEYQTGTAQRVSFDKALADAHQAVALAPELGEAHLALARVLEDGFFDFAHARDEYSRALSLAPGNARVLQRYGWFEANMGSTEAGVAAIRRAVVLDPLSTESHSRLGEAQWVLRRYTEAVATFDEVITLDPDASRAYGWRGLAYYGLGDLQSARSSCEAEGGGRRGWALNCLALVYDKLGRRVDAEAMVMRSRAEGGDRAAYQFAEVYAQWGNPVKALEWLDTAVRLSDPGLGWLKRDPLLDPLRKEPRFQAIERELKFPK